MAEDETPNGVLRYKVERLQKDLQEVRDTQNRIIWLLVGTVFSVTGALIVAALLALSSQGRL